MHKRERARAGSLQSLRLAPAPPDLILRAALRSLLHSRCVGAGRQRPVPLARHLALDEIALELATDELRAFAAHAHQPDTTLRQALDRRDSDLLGHAADHHDAFFEIEMDDAAHLGSARLAAASASRR